MKKTGHKKQILIYLKAGNKLTKLDSLCYFGCWNTGARISELKLKDGYNIKTTMIQKGKKRFAQYSMEND